MPRFTFKKTERLSSLKAIDVLYSQGRSFRLTGLTVIYNFHQQSQPSPCQVVFSVPKKSFKKAVHRNLLKRRMKEAYRLQKSSLYQKLVENSKYLHLMFVYNTKEISDFEQIKAVMQKALESLAGKADN